MSAGSDYWSKKLRAPVAVAAEVNAVVATRATESPTEIPTQVRPASASAIFVARDKPTGAGYLLLICLLAVVAGLVDRDGSRTLFLLGALGVLVVGAAVLWYADWTAVRRVEIVDDEVLLLISNRGQQRIAIADVEQVDTVSSKLAQMFNWDELVFRTESRAVHIRRPDDPNELLWRLEQLKPGIRNAIHKYWRPIIVDSTVISLSATWVCFVLSTIALRHEVTRGELTLFFGEEAIFITCVLLLYVASQTAWRFLVVVIVGYFGLSLIGEWIPAWFLGAHVAWFGFLLSPGLKRWALD